MSNETQSTLHQKDSTAGSGWHTGVRIAMPIFVLATAAGIAFYLIQTPPRAERAFKEREARLVEIRQFDPKDHQTVLQAWGRVRPANEVTLKAQVQGKVIGINPKLAPGGRFQSGEMVLKIDPSDFELAVQQRQSDLTKARADLRIEEGNQVIARREAELLKAELSERDKELVLRQPQLNAAKATVAAAEAALSEARLALERTTIRAPFDSIVLARQADIGTHLTTSAEIATLAGTETYWVELAVRASELRWIQIPTLENRAGSPARLYNDSVWEPTSFREGQVIRLLGDLTAEGRMARVLVAVRDPLALRAGHGAAPALLIGAFLRAEILGKTVKNAISLDRSLLRDDDKVWIMNKEDRLEVRPVQIAFRGSENVLITAGLKKGERVIVSNLAAATPGMLLRTADNANANEWRADRPALGTPSESKEANP